MTFYEIYYRGPDNIVVYCGDVSSESLAIDEITLLGIEFPSNQYWYEAIEAFPQ